MRVFQNIILFIVIISSSRSTAQHADIERRIFNELKMNFPSIYFKHNSTDYAIMPYALDSAYKFIAKNFDENINSLVMWRDSMETEALLNKRIQKVKLALRKYTKNAKCEIYSMQSSQKLMRHTIQQASDSSKFHYLLSLNSVFEVSKSKVTTTIKYTGHIMNPSIFCWGCWKSGFHWRTRMKMKQVAKQAKKKSR